MRLLAWLAGQRRRIGRGLLALLGLGSSGAGLAGPVQPLPPAADQPAAITRVHDIRARLLAADAHLAGTPDGRDGTAGTDGTDGSPPAAPPPEDAVAQWYNWPNWANWSKWGNWNNWNNWLKWGKF